MITDNVKLTTGAARVLRYCQTNDIDIYQLSEALAFWKELEKLRTFQKEDEENLEKMKHYWATYVDNDTSQE